MPPEHDAVSSERFIELSEISASIKKFIEGSSDEVLKEIGATPSPNGARPKTNIFWDQSSDRMKTGREVLSPDYEPWIIKFFESKNELTMIEHVYTQLAGEIGLYVPETRLLNVKDEAHFITKRFDRRSGHKLHQASLSGLTHKDFMEQNALSYEEYLRYTRMITANHVDVEEAFRRMLFNVVGVNCDDHTKNFSFLMDNTGAWNISPAYDLIYSNGPANYGEHKMSINNKNKEITLNDIAQCGYSGGLEAPFMKAAVESVLDGYSSIGDKLKESGVTPERVSEIVNAIDSVRMRISEGLSFGPFPEKVKKKGLFGSAKSDIYKGFSIKP
ncbi:MAG: HipA domain-containing protein [Paludibacter sp.]|nr:HipA domain-containing protein [Paludibacter sp.]